MYCCLIQLSRNHLKYSLFESRFELVKTRLRAQFVSWDQYLEAAGVGGGIWQLYSAVKDNTKTKTKTKSRQRLELRETQTQCKYKDKGTIAKQMAEDEYETSTLLQKIMTIYTGCPKKIPHRIFEFGHLFFLGRLGTFGHFGHPRAFWAIWANMPKNSQSAPKFFAVRDQFTSITWFIGLTIIFINSIFSPSLNPANIWKFNVDKMRAFCKGFVVKGKRPMVPRVSCA